MDDATKRYLKTDGRQLQVFINLNLIFFFSFLQYSSESGSRSTLSIAVIGEVCWKIKGLPRNWRYYMQNMVFKMCSCSWKQIMVTHHISEVKTVGHSDLHAITRAWGCIHCNVRSAVFHYFNNTQGTDHDNILNTHRCMTCNALNSPVLDRNGILVPGNSYIK